MGAWIRFYEGSTVALIPDTVQIMECSPFKALNKISVTRNDITDSTLTKAKLTNEVELQLQYYLRMFNSKTTEWGLWRGLNMVTQTLGRRHYSWYSSIYGIQPS